MIKALIFDCLGVVLTEYNDHWIEKHLNPAGRQALAAAELYPKNDLDQISDEKLYSGLSKLAGQSPAETEREIKSFIAPVRGMPELVRRYHGTYQTAILSNASSSLRHKLDEFGLQPLFDKIVVSGEVGVRKPDPKIFQVALDLLRVQPSEAIFIDDKLENVLAAEGLGIMSVQFVSVSQLENALGELLG
ncbi:MAG: HAD family phosphatase [Candidatus Nomurabacteria bacterium]|nr:HAD family phosphatase [Candidatus Nomurabacteria bacterium]